MITLHGVTEFTKLLNLFPVKNVSLISTSEYIAEILPTCRNFDVYKHAKINPISNFLFLRLLWVLWECLIMPINNDSITLQETLWWPKCWNKFVGNFDVYLHAKKSTSSLTSFLRYFKEIANLLFWVI